MNFRHWTRGIAALALLALGLLTVAAQELPAPQSTPTKPADRNATPTTTLPPVVVTAKAPTGLSSVEQSTPPAKERYQLPVTTHSTDAEHIRETVNIVDTEDAVKYFPSLFLRKRNNGDTQAVLQTRTWGINSSARSLVYADDILISALIGNNNTNSAPRWGLVAPEEIDRIDFLYGPYAAAYPGNSEGGVLLITTRMPDKLVVDGTQTEAFQTFSLYGTHDAFRTDNTNVVIGNKVGPVSWLLSGSYENSYSQPLAFVTAGAATPAGYYASGNKTGAPANVVGAGGLLREQESTINGKVAWDINPTLKATFDTALFLNSTDSQVQTYLRDGAGNPTFGGINSFANNEYTLDEKHLASSVSLKSTTNGTFDWDVSGSNYYYLNDVQRNPSGVTPTGTGFNADGSIASLTGTNWQNGDAKGIYRPSGGLNGEHEISFGVHADRYQLINPTFATPNWTGGPDYTSTETSDGEGNTLTTALWVQDAWRLARDWKLTYGGRLENWAAFDGFNAATASSGGVTTHTSTDQPTQDAVRFSPKVALDWTPSKEWEFTGSFGEAYRFPTVTELYQVVSSGAALFTPNPNLRPEDDFSAELAAQRHFDDGNIRLSFFNDYVKNALISQTNFTGATPLTYVTNVDEIRNTGVELAAEKDNVFVHGLKLFGSATYVNSEILSDPSFRSAAGAADAEGKKVPYVPDWRVTFGTTYRPDNHWSFTGALRYSGRQYSTLDNSDTTNGVFGSFDSFVVADVHAQYKVNDLVQLDAGIDNVNDEKYFLYHPFPQRTYVASVRVKF